MIFDNCAKYIYKKFEEKYSLENLKDKKIVLFGYEAVTKTLSHYLDVKGIDDYIIIDLDKYGQYWCEKMIINPQEVLPRLSENSIIFIINKYEKNINEINKYSNIKKESIVDFCGIRMDTLPNNLSIPENTRKIELRECQIELTELLADFHKFCEENKLTYFISSGTLLGALRHKGFIPWDDDLDILMPVKDYIKFSELYKGDERWEYDSIFNENVKELTVSTLSKIKSKTTFLEYHTFPIRGFDGVGLDIFPICGYPSDEKEQEEFEREFKKLEDLWKDKVVIPYGTTEYSKDLHRKIFDDMNKLLLKYEFNTSDKVGLGYFASNLFPGDDTRIMSRDWFEDVVKIEFENHIFNAPIGYDGLLKRLYRNYMELPPEEKRVPHIAKGDTGIRKII